MVVTLVPLWLIVGWMPNIASFWCQTPQSTHQCSQERRTINWHQFGVTRGTKTVMRGWLAQHAILSRYLGYCKFELLMASGRPDAIIYSFLVPKPVIDFLILSKRENKQLAPI